jgi:hypothetical protein
MKLFEKTLFWFLTIILGLMNPLLSIVIVLVYYLPSIIRQSLNSTIEDENERNEKIYQDLKERYYDRFSSRFSKHYSEDTLNEFK